MLSNDFQQQLQKKMLRSMLFETRYQKLSPSISHTVLANSRITLVALNPLPYFEQAVLVACLIILEASTGPKSQSQQAHTPTTPANMLPIPPQRFPPPSVRRMNDLSFPRMSYSYPLITKVMLASCLKGGTSVISSGLAQRLTQAEQSTLRCLRRSFISLWLGVMIVLNRLISLNSSGCWQRKQIASVSNTTTQLSGRFLTNLGKNACMWGSRPRPGPNTQMFIAFYHAFILRTHSSNLKSNSLAEQVFYRCETNTGWAMIYGLQDLMAAELNLEQKMWARSPPTFKEDIAEQQGAPVNSQEPPTTARRPF